MEELDKAHQLEVQILKLKNLRYTMVSGAIPPDMLKEIQNASDRKMNEQIARMRRDFRNTFNHFDLIPLWQDPSLA
ncbi:MAG: hypothetical protein OXI80_01700 [Caldilineaceae bacterium]|nr:hypothetical protein [Caldilineaceae bacterium]MDE0336359.1 hypothetical protein [Caldilineaceae bacterium]